MDSNRNPADDASWELTVEKLLSQDRWLQGPKFLWSEQTIFPDPLAPISNQDSEIKRQDQANQVTKVTDVRMLDLMIQRYSSLKKGVAWILLFKDYIRRKTHFKGDPTVELDVPHSPGELSLENLKSAERSIIGYVQKVSFPKVIDALRSSRSTRQEKVMLRNTGSLGSIYKLKPFLGKDGMLRVGRRLENAPLAYEPKHQLLLPHNHHNSKLLIMEHHKSVGHFGQEYVLSRLRHKYWIIKGRAAVRKVLGGCLTCRKQNAVHGQQVMADLPADRLTPGESPFSYVGIDVFGPLYVKQGRSTVKHYGCLFSCLTMRASHIEVTESLQTDSL